MKKIVSCFLPFLLLLFLGVACVTNEKIAKTPDVAVSAAPRTARRLPYGARRVLPYGKPVETDLILVHSGFGLGYDYVTRQAQYVSYILTSEQLSGKRVKRSNVFRADPDIAENPVQPDDYTGTGFDRGHLAPAFDMAYAELPMTESFFMSNISPQVPGCNRGIWKRLESMVRIFAQNEGRIYVITGPIFARTGQAGSISPDNPIPVPVAFFKVILDLTPPQKMIGFIIPNKTSKRQIKSFALPVDAVEEATGMDFFSGMGDKKEAKLESECNYSAWIVPAPKP